MRVATQTPGQTFSVPIADALRASSPSSALSATSAGVVLEVVDGEVTVVEGAAVAE